MHRRQFIQASGSCSAYVFGLAAFAPLMTRRVFAAQDDSNVVATELWGRLEKIQDGVWALISTPFAKPNPDGSPPDNPFGDYTTVCNGGIIAGDKGVLVVEAFMQDAGARWMSDRAKQLTGKRPTDVVCTHYHRDHTAGHAGFAVDKNRPNIWLTDATQKAAETSMLESGSVDAKFTQVKRLNSANPTEIDLGNRKVKVMPRSGHTSSDVTIELVDPKVIWCGDLFFNGMFPNYSDAIPSNLNDYASELANTKDTTFVPGHGPVAGLDAVQSYQKFLAFVQDSTTDAFKAGKPAEEAAKEFKLPDKLKEWFIWNPDVVKRGYVAWYRELEADKKDKRN